MSDQVNTPVNTPEAVEIQALKPVDFGDRQTTDAPLISRIDMSESREQDWTESLKGVSNLLLDKGIMPAMHESGVPEVLANAAEAVADRRLGLAGDMGRSSGSTVSTLLRASGADVDQTMDIGKLNGQLQDANRANWKEHDYKPGDPLNPGDVLFTSMERQGRNVGIVGQDGKTIYSHSLSQNKFMGSQNWNSKFIKVMRPKES